MASSRFAGELRKPKHAFLRPWQWCWSASVRMLAIVPASMYLHSLPSHISFSLSKSYLSARVVVHKVEQCLEHVGLHVVDAHDGRGIALLHRAEHWRSGREHAPVRRERLVPNLEHHVGALLGQKEIAKVQAQVGRGHRHGGGPSFRLLHHPELDDGDVTPDSKRIALQYFLQLLTFDEPCGTPGTLGPKDSHVRHRFHPLPRAADKTESELGLHRLGSGNTLVEEGKEKGDAICEFPRVAIRAVVDAPAVAADSERAGFEVLAGRDTLGEGVAVDLENAMPPHGVGDDSGGRRGRPRRLAEHGEGECHGTTSLVSVIGGGGDVEFR
ncbi:hypothetical protein BS78_05G042700 [Paspalum vaginatum]|nr:hypothetical protein BS78_05G042700 [Paspalum vaginatum]